MNHIFISHSHEDIDFAENLHSRLIQEGFAVWRDTGIRGGEDWRIEIDAAIKGASALIVIMTPEAKASEYVTYEWAFAWGAGVKVIPIMLKRTGLHPRLESLQYLDFTNRNVRPWDKLIELLSAVKLSKPQDEQPGYQIHAYSGLWEVENRFSRWRGYALEANDTVYFHGSTFLLLRADNKKGSGTQNGELYVSIGNYKAKYEVANRISRANVDEDGTLHIYPKVLSRTRVEESGEPKDAGFREALFGSAEFHVELKPAPGQPRKLIGIHEYKLGNIAHQQAEEFWTYLGL